MRGSVSCPTLRRWWDNTASALRRRRPRPRILEFLGRSNLARPPPCPARLQGSRSRLDPDTWQREKSSTCTAGGAGLSFGKRELAVSSPPRRWPLKHRHSALCGRMPLLRRRYLARLPFPQSPPLAPMGQFSGRPLAAPSFMCMAGPRQADRGHLPCLLKTPERFDFVGWTVVVLSPSLPPSVAPAVLRGDICSRNAHVRHAARVVAARTRILSSWMTLPMTSLPASGANSDWLARRCKTAVAPLARPLPREGLCGFGHGVAGLMPGRFPPSFHRFCRQFRNDRTTCIHSCLSLALSSVKGAGIER